MYTKGSKVKVAQSNGLSLRDGPNPSGTILYKIPNETILTVKGNLVSECFWINVEYQGLNGWAVADDGRGTVNVKILPKPVKSKRRYRKRAKKTDSS